MHFIILLDIDNDSVTLFILADQQKKKKKKNSRQDLAGGPLVANTCCRGI